MGEELKPVNCGCGGEAVVYVTHWWGKCYVCECDECGMASRPCNTESEAITAWNRAIGDRTAKVENIEDPAGLGAYGDCSECGAEVTEQYAYCPNCGCKLEWK